MVCRESTSGLRTVLLLVSLLAPGGCSGPVEEEVSPLYDLSGVNLSEDLRPALEAARVSLERPERETKAARDVALFNDLVVRIQRPESRREAGDELYALWRAAPDHFLWIIAAVKYEYLLRRGDEYKEMFRVPVLADTSGPVGAFARGCDTYGYGSRGEPFLRAGEGAASLDSLQRVFLSIKLATVESDNGKSLDAVRRLLGVAETARLVGGRRLALFPWYYVVSYLVREDRLDDALQAVVLGSRMAEKTGDPPWIVRFHLLYASVLEARREHAAALDAFEECARMSTGADLPWLFADSMDRAAALCSALGDPARALRFDRENLAHGLLVDDSLNVPRNMMNVANDFRMMGRLDSSFAYQEEARAWVDAYDDERNKAMMPLLEAEYYCQVGAYATAESLLAMARGRAGGATLAVDEARIDLGLIRQGLEMGQPDLAYEAIGRLEELRPALHDEQPDQNLVADFEIATAEFLGGQGEFHLAREALERAKGAVDSGGGKGKEWEYQRAEGRLALLRGDYRAAAAAFRRCLDLARESANPEWLAASRFHLGHILLEEGRYDRARRLFLSDDPERGELLFGGRFRTRLSALLFLGVSFSREGKQEEALERFRRAEEMITQHSPPDLKARLLIEKGRTLSVLRRFEEAKASLDAALELVLTQNSWKSIPELRAFHEDEFRAAAEAWIGLCADHPRLVGGNAGVATLLLAEKSRLASFPERGGAGTGGDVRRFLDEERPGVVLSYFVGRDRSFLWVCHAGAVQIYDLPGRPDLMRVVLPVLADMENSARRVDEKAATELGDLLLGPAVGLWEEETTLRIVPDDLLSLVPWCALFFPPESGRGPWERVVDHGPVVEEPSLGWFLSGGAGASPAPPESLSLLALGVDGGLSEAGEDRLPRLRHAEREAESVAALWGERRATLRLGADASWRAAADSLDRYGVIHIASHAVVHQGAPSRASLRLAGGEGETPLTIAAAARLDLDAELIYLSCCEAARKRSGTGGVADFARAFLVSGARSVIASTIRVDDEASLFFAERFYRHWFDGMPKEKALRAARLDVRRAKPEWRHPYFWAFYQLVGDTG